MKKVCIFLSISFFNIYSQAQDTKVVKKIVPILTQQNFFVNGAMRSVVDGQSRVSMLLKLPPNTIEWYYVFTTHESAVAASDMKRQITLVSQLTKALDPTGISATVINNMVVPDGTSVCDVYLLDSLNNTYFLNKEDYKLGEFKPFLEGSRKNFKSGVVHVNKPLSVNLYIGIRNPSLSTGTNVSLEVAALVQSTEIIQKTDLQQKAELYKGLSVKAFKDKQWDKCFSMTKLSLDSDATQIDMKAQLAWLFLIKKDFDKALELYVETISVSRKLPTHKKNMESMTVNLNLISDSLVFSQRDDILMMLKSEIDKK